MSELSIFLFGVLVFFMCGCAAIGPFLYSAWQAEKNWLRRKRKNLTVARRPAAPALTNPIPVQAPTRRAA